MAERKVIAVVGATGAQGGGLVRAILEDPQGGFAVRAITRDVASPAAKALADLGAEVVAADVDDAESVKSAFAGAYGAFCVTFFWAHFSPEKELAHAENMANAAQAAGVKHVIWSTLEDTRKWVPLSDDRMPTLGGKYKVPHFDAKGEGNHFFTDRALPVTFLNTAFYWDNLIHFGMGPKRGEDGTLAMTFPMGDKRLPGIAAEDIGRAAYGIFKRGPTPGETVGIAGELITVGDMAQELSKALGEPVRYNPVEPAVYRSFGFPGAEDLGNMFQVKRDFEKEYCASRDVEGTRTLYPGLQSFAQWVAKHARQIPLAMILALTLFTTAAAAQSASPQPRSGDGGPVDRGRYIVAIGGCHDCHSPKIDAQMTPDAARLLSGRPMSTPPPVQGKGDIRVSLDLCER